MNLYEMQNLKNIPIDSGQLYEILRDKLMYCTYILYDIKQNCF